MPLSFIIMVVLAPPLSLSGREKRGPLCGEKPATFLFPDAIFGLQQQQRFSHRNYCNNFSTLTRIHLKRSPKNIHNPKNGERMGLPSHPLHHSLSPSSVNIRESTHTRFSFPPLFWAQVMLQVVRSSAIGKRKSEDRVQHFFSLFFPVWENACLWRLRRREGDNDNTFPPSLF